MKGFAFMVMTIIVLLHVLTFVTIRKVLPAYRKKRFAYIWGGVTAALAVELIWYWSQDQLFSVSPLFVQMAILWCMAQVVLLLLLICYVGWQFSVKKWMNTKEPVADPSRRKLLQRTAAILPAAAIGISGYGTFYESQKIVLLQHEIHLPNLSKEFYGFKIAQISDAHIGLFFSVEKLQILFERLLEYKPDMVAITGDLIDDLTCLPALVRVLNTYSQQFPNGIWFCWGNHEYFRSFTAVEQALQQSNIHILRNSHARLVEGKVPLYILGVDYPWEKEAEAQRKRCNQMLQTALQGVPEDSVKLLLGHHSLMIDAAFAANIDLALTGHTHGGQIAVFGHSILPVQYKYMRGMYRNKNAWGYVSTGAGSWFPFRFGCPAETAIFTLKNS